MKIINNFKEYIVNNKFVINIYDNLIDIINYTSIGLIEENKISIIGDNKNILIIGKNLSLKKMLNKEILISGIIKKIEFR